MSRDVIVVGASAGGVEPLRTLMRGLPADLPASVLVVLHVPATGGSVLPAILDRAGPLPARHAREDEPLTPGTVLVAPPDHHLLLRDSHVVLTRGPRENGHRPAIDALFRSAARAVGSRTIGVVLSGVLDDGTAGLVAVKAAGGAAVVQDPADALYPAMPTNALRAVDVDHVARVEDLPALLVSMLAEPAPPPTLPTPDLLRYETDIAAMNADAMNADPLGRSSGFSCPDCNGVLFELRDDAGVRYRCRVGHAWSAQALLGEQGQQLDDALWMALRSLEEKASLARTMGRAATERGNTLSAGRFEEQAADSTRAATLIRAMLEAHVGVADNEPRTG